MIRSLNTINRNMNILQKKQENTSANITNVNTPGFKFQDIVQSTMETHQLVNYAGGRDANRRQELGGFIYGNQIDEIYRNFEQGTLVETGNFSDFAIIGNGFFTIQMDDGTIAYTRNGNFKLNENNELVTMEGYIVLGSSEFDEIGPIVVEDNDFTNINFLISDFNDYRELTSIGDTIFTADEGLSFAINGEVKQAFLESSNVVIVDELVKMIEISREFEANQKLLHTADETLNKAVNEVGRV
jgi:flagellar basal-body rod protein FlgG